MLRDWLRRAWGFLVDRLLRSMGCLFRCFRARDDDAGPKLRISVADPVQAPLVSRNKLSSLLLVQEHSPIDDGSKRRGTESPENNDEEVGLRDEASFLKACGTVLHTPAEIRNASQKIGTGEGENISARFNSWFSGAAYKQQSACDSPRLSSLPNVLHRGLLRPSVTEQQVQSPTDEKVPPNYTLRSSPEDHVEIMINQSSLKSVRFQADNSPNLSNEKYNQRACGFLESEDEKSRLAGKWLSPFPTPLVVPNGVQTPGTVYPTMMESLDNGKSTWVRPQFVYPVHNVDVFSKSNTTNGTADPSVEVSSGLGNSDKRFDLERPIIGGVAVYWDDKDHTEVSPKEWDGNGIPNSTTKYKEDQRVSWHATPFEERLEKALSDERLQPRRAINQLPIFYEGEENDTATSFSARVDIAV